MSKFMDYLLGVDNYDTYSDDEYYFQVERTAAAEVDTPLEEEKKAEFDGFEKTNFGVVALNNAMLFYILGNNVARKLYSND